MARKITLRPSVLVRFITRLAGGVTYIRRDLSDNLDGNTETKTWETTRVVEDTEEHARASRVRSALYQQVRKVCADTVIGLICQRESEAKLDEALAKCDEMAREFNSTAKTCRLACIGVKFNVEASNEAAAKAIAGQIQDMLVELKAALAAADVQKIREVLASARGLETTLPTSDGEALGAAVKAARVAARTIKREVEKKQRDIEEVKREIDLAPVEAARAFFLDLSEDKPTEAVPLQETEERGAALLQDPEDEEVPAKVSSPITKETPRQLSSSNDPWTKVMSMVRKV